MSETLFVLDTGTRVEVFNDPVSEVLVLDRTLAEHQQLAAEQAGLSLSRVKTVSADPPYFVTPDHMFFTRRLLKDFANQARTLGTNAQLGLLAHPALDATIQIHPGIEPVEGGYLFDIHYVKDPNDERRTPVLLELDDLTYSTHRFPSSLWEDQQGTFLESSRGIVPVTAPVHLWMLSLHANVEHLRDLIDPQANFRTGAAFGARPDKNSNIIGHRVSVHPSAVIEGSTLGDGTSVGAHTVVRHSFVGPGVVLADQVVVHRSVVMTNTQIHAQSRIVHGVMYPECFLSTGPWQFCFMGHASAAFAMIPTDYRLDQTPVRTPIGGRVVNSGLRFLGCLMGHHARLAGGVVTAPGRVVPNNGWVYPHPSLVYHAFPPRPPEDGVYFLGTEEDDDPIS